MANQKVSGDAYADFKSEVPDYIRSESDFDLYKMRHTAEHVLHKAVTDLFPEAKRAMGPPTAEGFYFDFALEGKKITEEDFPAIEKRMQEIIKADLPIVRQEISIEDAKDMFKNNKYKLEWIEEASKAGKKLTIYWTGSPDSKDSDPDLCKGPHIGSTGQVKAFKLLSVAGAYWRGSEKNEMLTRIYGTAFFNKEDLDKYLWQQEEAKRRDHREIAKRLKIFTQSENIGAGLPLWLPNGTIVKDQLEKWGKETEEKWGYQRVSTPFMTKRRLFEISGHVPYFEHEMYKVEVPGEDKEDYFIKPMNCPFHHAIYATEVRSYKELPLRLAEYGTVARYEDSGSLNGILRPRLFVQNDAHVYCTEEQAIDEFVNIIRLHQYYYDTLGLKGYYAVLALRDPKKMDKYHGSEELWKKAEELSKAAMEKSGIEYVVENEGAAHYGPKMDFKIKSSIGTEYGISTNQIDLYMPQQFDLKYVDKDGTEKYVVVQHRAPLGSSERFVGVLLEHFDGALPLWLHFDQVAILPISSEKHLEYANKVRDEILSVNPDVRIKVDNSNESLGKKIRNAQMMKVPYILVVGDKEMEAGKVAVRLRTEEDLGVLDVAEFAKRVDEKIKSKSLDL